MLPGAGGGVPQRLVPRNGLRPLVPKLPTLLFFVLLVAAVGHVDDSAPRLIFFTRQVTQRTTHDQETIGEGGGVRARSLRRLAARLEVSTGGTFIGLYRLSESSK